MSLVQNYWNLIGRVVVANVDEKKKKEKEAENWPQNLLTSIHFFIRNRP